MVHILQYIIWVKHTVYIDKIQWLFVDVGQKANNDSIITGRVMMIRSHAMEKRCLRSMDEVQI